MIEFKYLVYQIHKNSGEKFMAEVHEFIVLRFQENMSKEEQIQCMKKLNEIFSTFEGLVKREVFYSEEDDRWVDNLVWENLDYALASEKADENAEAKAIFKKMDPESIVFSRYEKII